MASYRLLLVDGHALMYRAFHALPALRTRDGIPTNAVFGFIRMFEQILRRWQPTHRSVVFDGGVPEERRACHPGYKANRPGMPEAMAAQWPRIEDYLAGSGVPGIRIEGQEADDVMATLARRAEGQGADVLIATQDKDLFQVVSLRVAIVPLVKQGARMGPDEVRARTGVAPGQVPAWLALSGDAADAIPGVPGVGPKTAAHLLQSWGSLEGLRAHLPELRSERLRRALEEHWGRVARNLRLVALRDDLPVFPDWKDMAARPPDSKRVRSFLKQMEFASLNPDTRRA